MPLEEGFAALFFTGAVAWVTPVDAAEVFSTDSPVVGGAVA